jgi:hypothetical protein
MQTSSGRPRAPGCVRHPGDVLRLVLGALILLATMSSIPSTVSACVRATCSG